MHLLIDAGADPNALTTGGGSETPGPGSETPLHYAASSDDVDVAAALIDRGADLETPDGSIGTPLDNAVGYACWHVARLLVMRGARVEKVWHAGALGMLDRLDDLLVSEIDPEQISQGFWHACGAGQRRAAERLLSAGADLNWEPDYAQGTAARRGRGPGDTSGKRHHLAPREGRSLISSVGLGKRSLMEMRCAECGCLVDAGKVVERCDDPDCCCHNLPDRA